MNVDELLAEAFDRLPALVRAAVEGLSPARLCTPPPGDLDRVADETWDPRPGLIDLLIGHCLSRFPGEM